MDTSILAFASKHLARVSNPDAIRKHPVFRFPEFQNRNIYVKNKQTLCDGGGNIA